MNKKQTAIAINELLETPMTANEIKKMSASKLTDKLSALQAADATTVLPVDDGHMSNAEVNEALATPANEVTSSALQGIGAQVAATQPEVKTILRKSAIESPCQFVWQTCEDMKLGETDGARRKDVLAACTEAGVAYYTARTQIQLWRKAKNAPIADPLTHNENTAESVALDASGNPVA